MSETIVHTTYSKSLNVCVSSKGTVTLWTTGNSGTQTKRLSSINPGTVIAAAKVKAPAKRTPLRRVAG